MMELEYIPLKTAEGVTLGHAKVRSGTVEVCLRAGGTGEAVVLTDGGSFSGSPGVRIHTAGRVQAVALREGGELRCCGVSRHSAFTAAEVRLRLSASAAQKPQRQSVADRPASVKEEPPAKRPAPEPEKPRQAPSAERPAAEPERARPEPPAKAIAPQEQPAPEPTRPELIADDGRPFHPDTAIKQALSRLAEETAAEFLDGMRPEPSLPERVLAAPAKEADERRDAATLADTAADTEAFSALMARADAVFHKIDAPLPDTEPLDPVGRDPVRSDPVGSDPVWRDPVRSDPVWRDPVRSDSGGSEAEDWCSAVDELLHAGRAQAGRIPVQNPFPHIFPGARFYMAPGGEAGALKGEWLSGREHMCITAVKGDYSPQPPEHLAGYTRYIRAKSGGYWVKVDGAN